MPIKTGITVRAKITSPVVTSPTSGASGPMNSASAIISTSGTVTTDNRLASAVREIDSATSPRAMWVRRLEVVPPGQAASSTMPTLSAGGAGISATMAMASRGSVMNCSTAPVRKALGWAKIRRKSAGVSPTPSASMMKASASGRSIWAKIESMMPDHVRDSNAAATVLPGELRRRVLDR